MDAIFEDSAFAKAHLSREGCEQLVRDTLDGSRNLGWQIWSVYLCSVAYDLLRSEERYLQ